MSHEAIAKIFALQQEEKRKNEEAARKNRERQERERRALAESPVIEILRALADVPLKKELAVQFGANQTFASLIQYYRAEVFAGRVNELIMKISSGSNAVWACRECRDSGRMIYEHRTGNVTLVNDHTPDKSFVDTFITFAAKYLDPAEIANRLGQTAAAQPVSTPNHSRRILQVT